jgi:hypothetical protein
MKPKEQRIAIAEACGWEWIQTNYEAESGLIGTDSPHSGNIPYQGRNYPSNKHLPMYGKAIPDYLNDLNAMHEAEKTLNDDELFKMSRFLQHITRSTLIGVAVMTASAPKRAEAFLKTIDKWTTNQNEL